MRNILLALIAFILIILLTIPISIFQKIRFNKEKESIFFFNLAKNLDYVGGTLLYNMDGITVSAGTYYYYDKTRKTRYLLFLRFIDFLFMDKDHCLSAFLGAKNKGKFNGK
jgi:hypothetical protein